MAVQFDGIVSEVPFERLAQIRDLLAGLDLGEGRLDTGQLETVARAVAARDDLYEDLIVDDEEQRWWLLLYQSEAFEVKLLTWERHQSSNWHDHGGSSGAFVVARGTLVERHGAPDHVSIEAARFSTGDYASFAPGYVHDILFESGKPAVSIHVYSPPLSGLTIYDSSPYGFIAREFIPEEVRSATRTQVPVVDR